MFEQFNNLASELSREFTSIKKEKKEYKEVPYGKYEVKIDSMQLGKNKVGDKPMFKVQFRIIAGEHKNSCLFWNQVVTKSFQLGIVNDFLRSLKVFNDEIKFTDFNNYYALINEIFELISDRYEFALEYTNDKGFNKYTVTNVFALPF